ncbi:MAG: hypothetical protein ACTSYR_02125 [Candidatus Odinarchaeia archaeon]
MVFRGNLNTNTVDYSLLLEDLEKEKGKQYSEALLLRLNGYTFKTIGKLLNIPSWKARRIVKEGLKILKNWLLEEQRR